MMKIEVTIPNEIVDDGRSAIYLAKAMTAIGYSRFSYAAADDEAPVSPAVAAPAPVAESKPEPAPEPAPEPEPEPVGIRYHGQPEPGKKRRTKEEIALDEEAVDLLEAVDLTVAKFNSALDNAHGDWDVVIAELRAAAKPAAPAEEEPKANISTGEERTDTAEEEAGEPLTHDNVREALGDYAAKFGMPAAQKNGPKLMGADKISAIPDEQSALRKAVDAVRAAIAEG